MARLGCRGVVCGAAAAVAALMLPGCGEELYPQYSGTFRLVSVETQGASLDGLPMPNTLELNHRMRHSGHSFVHLVEIRAPDGADNAETARGSFLVPLSSLLHEPAAGTSENLPDYPGVQVLPSRRVIRLGTWCSADYLYTLAIDAGSSAPHPRLLQRIYQATTTYAGVEVQTAPNRVDEAPIDESARDAWLSTASSNDGVRITLILMRRVHSVVSGCQAGQDLDDYATEARVAATYETAGPWVPTQTRDPRKSSSHVTPPSNREIEGGLAAFFSQIFGAGGSPP